MLLILLSWAYVLLVAFLYGHFCIEIFRRSAEEDQAETMPHFSLVVLTGFICLTSLASIAYLFSPLNLLINLAFLVPALAYGIWNRDRIQEDIHYYMVEMGPSFSIPIFKWSLNGRLVLWGLFFLCLGVALVSSAIPSHYYDDGLYYTQFIKWINEYAIVPGLGNLHPRLAFNSNWHLLSALFSFADFKLGTFTDLNGLMHVLAALYGLSGLRNLLQGEIRVSNVFRALLILPTHLLVGYLMAPTADTPVVYLIWFILILFIQKIEAQDDQIFDLRAFMILLLGAFVCTIKLSAFPIVILPLYLVFKAFFQESTAKVALILITGVFIALPWMARNVILSGYVFYPFYQIDLFDVDWKVPTDLVAEEVTYIGAFAAGESMVRSLPYPEIHKLSMGEWFPRWYGDLRTSNKGIFFLVILLTAGYFILFLKELITNGIRFLKDNTETLLLFGTLYAGLAFWFLKAPDFRFGYAFTVALYLLSFSFFFQWALGKEKWFTWVLLLLIGTVGVFYLKPVKDVASRYVCLVTQGQETFLVKPGVPISMVEETHTTRSGLMIYQATCNDQCWGTALPCSPFVDIGTELRTPARGLQGGFKNTAPDIDRYRRLQIGYQPLSGKEPRPVRCNALCE